MELRGGVAFVHLGSLSIGDAPPVPWLRPPASSGSTWRRWLVHFSRCCIDAKTRGEVRIRRQLDSASAGGSTADVSASLLSSAAGMDGDESGDDDVPIHRAGSGGGSVVLSPMRSRRGRNAITSRRGYLAATSSSDDSKRSGIDAATGIDDSAPTDSQASGEAAAGVSRSVHWAPGCGLMLQGGQHGGFFEAVQPDDVAVLGQGAGGSIQG